MVATAEDRVIEGVRDPGHPFRVESVASGTDRPCDAGGGALQGLSRPAPIPPRVEDKTLGCESENHHATGKSRSCDWMGACRGLRVRIGPER